MATGVNEKGAVEGVALPATETPGPILLVRHGRPDLARKGWLSPDGWDAWWKAYGQAGLADGECPPRSLVTAAAPAVHRLASPVIRARQTAERLFGDLPFEQDRLFVEAPLPAPPWPNWIRLSPPLWGAVSRTLWLCGFAGQGESYAQARQRARQASDRLVADARDGMVVVCAHGWFNRMMRGELVRRGWTCDRDGGDHYWSWRRMICP